MRLFSPPLLGIHFVGDLTLGDALVAGGTLALAGVTFWLAWQTRREVALSTDSIDLSRQGLEAQDMPFVIAVRAPRENTVGTYMTWGMDEHEATHLRLRLWNIGRGPAIVRDVRVELEGDVLEPLPREIPIGAKEVADLEIPAKKDPPPGNQVGAVRVYYAHSSGTEYMTKSSARVAERGVRCTDFDRAPSDREARAVGG